MLQTFALQVPSTGETILAETTDLSLRSWHKHWERKVLRHKSRAERFKEAVRQLDTIVGWVNYDDFVKSVDNSEIEVEIRRVFRGYDKFIEDRVVSKGN